MINIVVTTAGRQALLNASETGTNTVQISKIGVGIGRYTPAASQTALQNEVKRLSISEGGIAGDNAIHVAYQDESEMAYSVYEFGLFLSDGTLFAVYSSDLLILQKTPSATAILAVDIAFADIDVEQITFGDVTFGVTAATTTQAGVLEVATDAEVLAGEATQLAVTPANLGARTASQARIGLVALASEAEGIAGTDTKKAVTPAVMASAINAAIASNVVPASTTQAGIIEIATDDEVVAGTDGLALTPANISALTATANRAGVVKLATPTQTTAGTSASVATTPVGVKAVLDSRLVAATTSAAGIVELATQTEALAGVDATRAITPLTLHAAIDDHIVDATVSVKGIVELATNAETQTGTDTTRVVTPASLTSRTATASRTGLVELATNAEATTGTDATKAVTPAGTRAAISGYTGVLTPSSLEAGFVKAGTASNMSLFPSGRSIIMGANTGSVQAALARFTNDASGTSMVFYKSRASSTTASKSVIPGDTSGIITFLVDNGNINPSGTAVGACVAKIEGEVLESSTITSAGTTNVGVRGILKLTVCSDANTRDTKGVEVIDTTLRPTVDNVLTLGTSGKRFKSIYAMSDVISTSDENQKQDIANVPEAAARAWGTVSYKTYRFISEVEEQGENAPTYCGVIAQDIIEAFEAAGLSAFDYGVVTQEEDGLYGVRYREAAVLEAAYQRLRLADLEDALPDVALYITDISYDSTTHILTVTYSDSTTTTIDLS